MRYKYKSIIVSIYKGVYWEHGGDMPPLDFPIYFTFVYKIL